MSPITGRLFDKYGGKKLGIIGFDFFITTMTVMMVLFRFGNAH